MNELFKQMDDKELELRLEQIKPIRDKFFTAFKEDEAKIGEVLNNFLRPLTWDKGLELLECHPRIGYGSYNEQWRIDTTLYFKTKDEGRIDRGYSWDFGSDINMYIHADHLELNYGTIGSYTKKDLGQISRVYLVFKLWENENELLERINDNLNINNRTAFEDLNREINDIQWELNHRKEEREKKDILEKIKNAKYLAVCRKEYLNCIWDSEEGTYKNETPIYRYTNVDKIDKITEKNVITIDNYWKERHLNNLDQVIHNIKCKTMALLDEKKEYDLIEE